VRGKQKKKKTVVTIAALAFFLGSVLGISIFCHKTR